MSTAPWPDAGGARGAPGGPGGDGSGGGDRGSHPVVEGGRVPLCGGQPPRLPAVRPRTGPDLGDRFQGQVTAPQGGLRGRGGSRLYCRSEERAHKERGIVERFSRRFEQGLARLSEGLSRPRAHKGIEKVRERIGRLKEQSRGVAQHYTIEVLTDESGRKATALTWKRQPRQGSMVTHPGVYCLRSNQDRLGRGEPVAHLCHSHRRGSGVSLPEVRTGSAPHLSSQAGALGRPPVPDGHRLSTGAGHSQTPQAAGRGLQLDHAAAHPGRTAAGHGDLPAWGRADLARTQVHAGRTDQKAIYDALGIDPAPGGVRKIIV